jgi:hypothetical protein
VHASLAALVSHCSQPCAWLALLPRVRTSIDSEEVELRIGSGAAANGDELWAHVSAWHAAHVMSMRSVRAWLRARRDRYAPDAPLMPVSNNTCMCTVRCDMIVADVETIVAELVGEN